MKTYRVDIVAIDDLPGTPPLFTETFQAGDDKAADVQARRIVKAHVRRTVVEYGELWILADIAGPAASYLGDIEAL